MKYEQLSKISESLEIFNDAKFLSLLDENTAVVQNTKTGSIHSLPFSFNENGKLEFHGDKAELLESASVEAKIETETSSLNSIAYAILKSKLNGNEEAYNEGVEFLKNNTFISKSKKEQAVTEDVIVEGTDRVSLDESEKEWVDSFSEKWEDKLSSVVESFKQFLSYGSLFENDEIRKEIILEPAAVIEAYKEKIEQSEALFKYSDKVITWFESVKEAVGENYSSKIFSKINPLSPSWKSDLTKALVTFKKEVSESKISIPEITKIANKKHAELFESDMQVTMGLGSDRLPGSSTGENKLNFLKLSGVFSQTDLGKLIEDFEYVLGSWPHMNEEDLKAVSEAKNKIDYMYRTCMIDDEAVANIINSFNSKYGKDGRDKLADPLLSAEEVIVAEETKISNDTVYLLAIHGDGVLSKTTKDRIVKEKGEKFYLELLALKKKMDVIETQISAFKKQMRADSNFKNYLKLLQYENELSGGKGRVEITL